MRQLINHGLYRTRDNSFVMFRWRRTGYHHKPFCELVNIVTGDVWNMSMSKPRTQRYLSSLTYTGAKVKCSLTTLQSYIPDAIHPDYRREVPL